jgi:glycosyltransferase involved in cell wall biosynthesis
MEPLVTVIIPCHNHACWVMDAIRSAAEQDYPHKRIVLVDDGSDDNSHLIAASLMGQPLAPTRQEEVWTCWGKVKNTDCTLQIQRLPRAHGPSFARNWGILVTRESAGDVYMFLDSDDYYLPGKMRKSVAAFCEDPQAIGMVYSDYDTLTPEGVRTRLFSEPYDGDRLLQDNIINPNSLVSKRALETVGGFDEGLRVCEDYDMWLRLAEHFSIIHIPESLAVKRVGPHDSTSTVPGERWRADYIQVKQKAMERRGS